MKKLFIEDLDVSGKRVLMRVDFNVPLDGDGNVADDSRIRAAIPSIRYVVERGGKLILMSHLGRPKGRIVPSMSLKPVAERLSALIGRPVRMLNDCTGKDVESAIAGMKAGDIVLLENLRFHPEEEKNDPAFSRGLASLGDLYINDAFGTAHRSHASVDGITRYTPEAAAGYLLASEMEHLGRILDEPARPFIAVLGGAKVSTKMGVIANLLARADSVLIGGAMSYTLLKARGIPVGSSLVENEFLETASSLLEVSARDKRDLLLPSDHLVAKKLEEGSRTKVVGRDGIEDGWIGVDIGPGTIRAYGERIDCAKTVFWNGPMGVFEIPSFSRGTEEIAKSIANSGAVSVVGGGDSIAALNRFGLADKVTHISTGGGASLEFLEGKQLPGIAALTDSSSRA